MALRSRSPNIPANGIYQIPAAVKTPFFFEVLLNKQTSQSLACSRMWQKNFRIVFRGFSWSKSQFKQSHVEIHAPSSEAATTKNLHVFSH